MECERKCNLCLKHLDLVSHSMLEFSFETSFDTTIEDLHRADTC